MRRVGEWKHESLHARVHVRRRVRERGCIDRRARASPAHPIAGARKPGRALAELGTGELAVFKPGLETPHEQTTAEQRR